MREEEGARNAKPPGPSLGRGFLGVRLVVLLRGASRPGGVVALDRTLRARLPRDDLLVSGGFGGAGEHHGTTLTHVTADVKWKIAFSMAEAGGVEPPSRTTPRRSRPVADLSAAASKVAESGDPASQTLAGSHPGSSWGRRFDASLSKVVASPGLAPGSSRSSGARLNYLSYLAMGGGEWRARTAAIEDGPTG